MKSFLRFAAFGLLAVSCAFCQVQTTATGNITSAGSSCTEANSTTNASSNCVVINIPENTATEAITLSNTFSGTVQFEKTADYGATWLAANAQPVPSGAIVTSATSTGSWIINVEGMSKVRVRCSTYSSGTVTVFAQSSTAVSTSAIASTGAAATQVQGPTAVSAADASTTNPVQIGGITNDGSSTVTKIKTDTSGDIATGQSLSSGDAVNNNNGGRLASGSLSGGIQLDVRPQIYNGTSATGWDRWRSASQTNFALSGTLDSVLPGILNTTPPAMWQATSQGTNTQCSASVAASGTGKKHVVTGCSVCVAGGSTPQTPIFANLRDGASGAGTIKAAGTLAAITNASACWYFQTTPMLGTSNTAATCELAVASAATVTCTANIEGYDQ